MMKTCLLWLFPDLAACRWREAEIRYTKSTNVHRTSSERERDVDDDDYDDVDDEDVAVHLPRAASILCGTDAAR